MSTQGMPKVKRTLITIFIVCDSGQTCWPSKGNKTHWQICIFGQVPRFEVVKKGKPALFHSY